MHTASRFPESRATRPFSEVSRLHSPPRPGPTYLPRCTGYDIRPTRTARQRGMASQLVRQMYEWRGYSTEAIECQVDDPNRVTIAAWQDDLMVATLTLGRDSPSGLMADTLYAQELAGLRHPGRVVCEVTRLAVAPDYSAPGLLTKLFLAAFDYAKDVFAASDAVIEVNPRHVRYYQNRMGFQQIGTERLCERVDAPAVLLHQTVGNISLVFEPNGATA